MQQWKFYDPNNGQTYYTDDEQTAWTWLEWGLEFQGVAVPSKPPRRTRKALYFVAMLVLLCLGACLCQPS